jgi:two-component system chemotaxis response regulator CheB
MSEVRVVMRHKRPPNLKSHALPASEYHSGTYPAHLAGFETGRQLKVVAIGASTGGPPVLQTIFSMLPPDFRVPIMVVQHIAAGFLQGMIDWLSQTSGRPIKTAGPGESLAPGYIYFPPEGFHMGLGRDGRITLGSEQPENGMRPSVSYLFRSVAGAMPRSAAGVLLTGMGKDGAMELKLIRDGGGITIAQDEESSVVHGMPGEAIKEGGAVYVLPPDRIAAMLIGMAV